MLLVFKDQFKALCAPRFFIDVSIHDSIASFKFTLISQKENSINQDCQYLQSWRERLTLTGTILTSSLKKYTSCWRKKTWEACLKDSSSTSMISKWSLPLEQVWYTPQGLWDYLIHTSQTSTWLLMDNGLTSTSRYSRWLMKKGLTLISITKYVNLRSFNRSYPSKLTQSWFRTLMKRQDGLSQRDASKSFIQIQNRNRLFELTVWESLNILWSENGLMMSKMVKGTLLLQRRESRSMKKITSKNSMRGESIWTESTCLMLKR